MIVYPSFIFVWCIEYFIVLEVVKWLLEQVGEVNDLRRQIKDNEKYVNVLKQSYTDAQKRANVGSSLPPREGPSHAG